MTSEANTVDAPAHIIDIICPRDSQDGHDLTVGEEVGVSELVRDTETWLEDGNIVLVAGTRDKSLLAAPSLVFADMFFASSPKADELFEGCPVVRLSDSPEEMKHLLDVLIPNVRYR